MTPLLLLVAFAADVSPSPHSFDATRVRLLRSVPLGEEFAISAAADRCGRRLALTRRDGRIELRDASGRVERILEGHKGYVFAAAFSPDGSRLASAGLDGVVRLWDVARGTSLQELTGHARQAWSVAWSGDGRRLASAGNDGVRIWDPATGESRGHLKAADVLSVTLAPDGSLVAAAGADGSVRLWELAGGRERAPLVQSDRPMYAVAFSPGGGRVAAAGLDGLVRIWNVADGKLHRELRHPAPVKALAYSADGRLLATGGLGGVRLYEADSGRKLGEVASEGRPPCALAFAGSVLASLHDDNRLRLLGAHSGAEPEPPAPERVSGFLGVSYTDAGGALIESLVDGSQAMSLGLEEGDVIIGVDAQGLKTSDEFLNFMRGTREGDEILLRVKRDGEELRFRAKLGRWKE